MPRAPLPSEAAAESEEPEEPPESDGHGVPCCSQAAQALHSGLEASAEVSQIPVGQHASHERAAAAESLPLESTDSPLIRRYVLQAEAEFMQVPPAPVQYSQSPLKIPVPMPSGQLL